MPTWYVLPEKAFNLKQLRESIGRRNPQMTLKIQQPEHGYRLEAVTRNKL